MDLKQLEALVAIADHGSFSSAAHALGTVQSNVSGRIARLERELDATLVERSTGELTEDGEIVAGRARRVLAELEALVADVVSAHSEVTGTVRAGMIGTTGRWLIPQVFEALRERHPRIKLRVNEGTSTSLVPLLLAGQLDLAVLTLPLGTDELSVQPLFEEDLVLVVPAGHPLALAAPPGAPPLPISELQGVEMLLPLQGTSMREEIDQVLSGHDVSLSSSIELDGLRTLASLVFDGYGAGILPATAVPEHMRGRFRLITLEGFPRRRVGLAGRLHGLPSAPTRAVREVLLDVASDDATRHQGIHLLTSSTDTSLSS